MVTVEGYVNQLNKYSILPRIKDRIHMELAGEGKMSLERILYDENISTEQMDVYSAGQGDGITYTFSGFMNRSTVEPRYLPPFKILEEIIVQDWTNKILKEIKEIYFMKQDSQHVRNNRKIVNHRYVIYGIDVEGKDFVTVSHEEDSPYILTTNVRRYVYNMGFEKFKDEL